MPTPTQSFAGNPTIDLFARVHKNHITARKIMDVKILWFALATLLGFVPPAWTIPVSPIIEPNLNLSAPIASADDEEMTQVTSVSQLADVKSTDWAFAALQSLVERYGCLSGYPDGSFRGEQKISRYEFAAALNTCLEKLSTQIIQAESPILQKLRTEFLPELTGLQTRIGVLETRTEQLLSRQFSPIVFFGGQAIFALAAAAGGNPPGTGNGGPILAEQTQLGIVASFSGRDRLQLALGTGNLDNLGFANPDSLNSIMALLNYQAGLSNRITLSTLEYRLPAFSDRVVFTFKPVGFSLSDILTANTLYADSGRGAISRFAAGNPIFQIGSLNGGVGFDWLVDRSTRLQVAYGMRESDRSSQGIFKANHSALGVQLLLKPSADSVTGFSYVNAYASDGRLDTLTGSFNADTSGTFLEPAQIHALGATYQWRFSPKAVFGTWGGIFYTSSLQSGAFAVSGTYLLSLGLYDPFERNRGDFLGLLIGIPPKLFAGGQIQRTDDSTSFHLETFYRYQMTDRISITPGFFIVTNPGHFSDNQTIFVGTIRTTFRF